MEKDTGRGRHNPGKCGILVIYPPRGPAPSAISYWFPPVLAMLAGPVNAAVGRFHFFFHHPLQGPVPLPSLPCHPIPLLPITPHSRHHLRTSTTPRPVSTSRLPQKRLPLSRLRYFVRLETVGRDRPRTDSSANKSYVVRVINFTPAGSVFLCVEVHQRLIATATERDFVISELGSRRAAKHSFRDYSLTTLPIYHSPRPRSDEKSRPAGCSEYRRLKYPDWTH